jgi:hypothetical protein
MTITDLEAAAARLNRSEKGRQAMADLLALLDNGALALDYDNQSAVLTLLTGAWGQYAGTARDVMREVLEP